MTTHIGVRRARGKAGRGRRDEAGTNDAISRLHGHARSTCPARSSAPRGAVRAARRPRTCTCALGAGAQAATLASGVPSGDLGAVVRGIVIHPRARLSCAPMKRALSFVLVG